jgi:hypothetical protein
MTQGYGRDNLFLVVSVYHKPAAHVKTERSTIYDKLDIPSLLEFDAKTEEFVSGKLKKTKHGTRTRRGHPDDTSWTINSANWQDTEVPELVSRVSANRLVTASVIIDLKNDKLIKNRFTSNDPADILRHFKQKYASQIPNFETKTDDAEVVHAVAE